MPSVLVLLAAFWLIRAIAMVLWFPQRRGKGNGAGSARGLSINDTTPANAENAVYDLDHE
jgi:hypothetical protein